MTLKIEKQNAIATVTIDRPPVNALTLALYGEIAETFEAAKAWDDVNVIVFTGAGEKAFCAGLDLNEFLAATIQDDPKRAAIVRRSFAAVRHAPVPVIAAVNGPAFGAGCVYASVADIRIAAEHARFGMPEINVGRCGGAAHMTRHLPQGLLRRMYFTGQPIDAREAWRVGFVQEVVPFAELAPTAQAMAAVIAAKAPIGLRMAKEALNRVEFMQTEDGYELEQSFSTRLMTTEDAREATRAVVEKRPPVFVGR
ncbi:enoyl-CoA hydratase-related protein [Prosthecodimorpha staleyi]|uniref:Enoyl-CoA hydratase/isomerase family protein n=1 Tax=Prosthecodimorpha staleyi TaxID=2840188 RepID=A0A947D386_9HYPH|nr:enoyl-CoA hydratase-related protein [Prosthecodimorpha staleyi]MBT9290190.1 enoyl-CoA hydratase/isomerase family protein [Prosthecodimorpha staleyi]